MAKALGRRQSSYEPLNFRLSSADRMAEEGNLISNKEKIGLARCNSQVVLCVFVLAARPLPSEAAAYLSALPVIAVIFIAFLSVVGHQQRLQFFRPNLFPCPKHPVCARREKNQCIVELDLIGFIAGHCVARFIQPPLSVGRIKLSQRRVDSMLRPS